MPAYTHHFPTIIKLTDRLMTQGIFPAQKTQWLSLEPMRTWANQYSVGSDIRIVCLLHTYALLATSFSTKARVGSGFLVRLHNSQPAAAPQLAYSSVRRLIQTNA